MSTIHRIGPGAAGSTNPIELAPLNDRQRPDSAAFLALYEQTARGVKAELIGGVVHTVSSVGYPHGDFVRLMALWVGYFELCTPGVTGSCGATTVLDDQGVAQPDVSLRILPAYGGQTHYAGKLLGGAPELVVEVADSSRPEDLGSKLADYERAGVLEYIVAALDPLEVYWNVRRNGRLERIAPDADGLYRSQAFPGLWLDPETALSDDAPKTIVVLDRGLATAEHADFAAALAGRVQG
jgi:Uma2 family endonuclease